MTGNTEDRDRGVDMKKFARGIYLSAVKTWLTTREPGARETIFEAYGQCMLDGEEISDGVAIKIGMMLNGLERGDEKAWAKFLSVHVGFTDPVAMAEFKPLSPYRDWIIIEQDAYSDLCQTIMLRGESRRYLAAEHSEVVSDRRATLISSRKDETHPAGVQIDRTFVAIYVSPRTH